MNPAAHYTDEDFQSYCDGTFTGDAAMLRHHVQNCVACATSLQAYQAIGAFAKETWEIKPLEIDLAAAVTQKVFREKHESLVVEKILYWMFACLAPVVSLFGLRNLSTHTAPGILLMLLIPVAAYLLLSVKEYKIIRNAALSGRQ